MPEQLPRRFSKWSIPAALVLILVGVGIGYGLTPTRTVTFEKEVIVEKPVTRYVKNPYEDIAIHDRRGRSTAPTSR